MLVYDITSEKSFENIKNWIRNIEEVTHNMHMVYIHFQVFVDVQCYVNNPPTCLLEQNINVKT